jgi:uncharacterized protein YycO
MNNGKAGKLIISLILIILVLIGIYVINSTILNSNGYQAPDYPKTDITALLKQDSFTDADYKELFFQTGLGRSAIDSILQQPNGATTIIRYQENFFTERTVSTITPWKIVKNEYTVNASGGTINAFDIAPYDNGYILIRSSAHTLGWRHGHAGLIVDAEKGLVLEAVTIGQNSKLRDINSWRYRPTFIMLKLKDDSPAAAEIGDQIAQFANDHLVDLPYRLTVGLFSDKNPDPADIKYTQCSHVVWYPYNLFGYDIDADGGWLVLPEDIAKSDLLEVVQIYGFDPNDFWRD